MATKLSTSWIVVSLKMDKHKDRQSLIAVYIKLTCWLDININWKNDMAR